MQAHKIQNYGQLTQLAKIMHISRRALLTVQPVATMDGCMHCSYVRPIQSLYSIAK